MKYRVTYAVGYTESACPNTKMHSFDQYRTQSVAWIKMQGMIRAVIKTGALTQEIYSIIQTAFMRFWSRLMVQDQLRDHMVLDH